MTRRIYQINNIVLAIIRLIIEPDCLQLNGNTPFPFQLHIIKYLVYHLPFGKGAGVFQNTVSQGRFSMVDMRYNTKITNSLLHNFFLL